MLQLRLSSLSNLDPGGSVRIRVVLSRTKSALKPGSRGFCQDPGGSVRIRVVLSNFLFCQTWIRGVLSGSGGFCQECCQMDPGGSVKDPGGSVKLKSAVKTWIEAGSGEFCSVRSAVKWIRGVLSRSPNFYTSGF